MKKLTLYLDAQVIEQAKRLAGESGTSVSSLFERLVRLLARKRPVGQRIGRITREASGLITLPRGTSERDILAEALAEKFASKK